RNGDGTSDTRGQSAYEERQRQRCRAYPQGPAADDGLKNARYIIGKVDTDKTVAVVGDEPQRRLAVRVVAEVIGEHDLFAVLQHEDEVVTPAHVALHGARWNLQDDAIERTGLDHGVGPRKGYLLRCAAVG